MARSRNIKPGFFTNDSLAECEPLARILFAGLWCHADREGRLEDRPKKLRAEILPYDDVDANMLLCQLAARGFIQRYVVDERAYIQVLKFLKHQNPHIKEQSSTIPASDMPGACPMQAPDMPGSCPADSLNPLTDSLNPETPPTGGVHRVSALPDWLDKEEWADFIQHRIEIKHPLTPKAAKRCLAELDRLRQFEDHRAIIHRTIANGWRSFFGNKMQGGRTLSAVERVKRANRGLSVVERIDRANGITPSRPFIDAERVDDFSTTQSEDIL